MHVESFDPRTATDEDILGRLSIDADGVATVPSAGLFPLPDAVRASGAVRIDTFALRLVRGVAQEGTRIEARAEDLKSSVKSGSLRGGAPIVVNVARGDLAGERFDGDAKLSLAGIKGALAGGRAPIMTVDDVELAATINEARPRVSVAAGSRLAHPCGWRHAPRRHRAWRAPPFARRRRDRGGPRDAAR